MIRALALDPGVTSGIAYCNIRDDKLQVMIGQQKMSLMELDSMLQKFVSKEEPSHIIYEDFTYRNMSRSGLDLTPVKLIGVIELYRERYEPLVGFYKQTAAQAKAYWSDNKLKEIGLYVRGKEHGRDATRHLLQWLKFREGSQYCLLEEMDIELV